MTARTFSARRFGKSVYEGAIRWGIPRVNPEVVRTLPHDTKAFTQGLVVREGHLYESTGTDQHSSVRCIDLRTGDLLHSVPVWGDFGEGIAELNGLLYQLSYKSGIARAYGLPDLNEQGTRSYEGEGWGLTSHEGLLVISNGTSILNFVDEAFSKKYSLRVISNQIPLRNINDIESTGSKFFANVYGSSDVFEISAATGRVVRILDCLALSSAAPHGNPAAVMNGIAFDANKGTLLVTGKYWDTIFEIAIPSNVDGANVV